MWDISTPNSQAFGLYWNYITGFPGPPACRWQIVELLSLHNHTLKRLPVKMTKLVNTVFDSPHDHIKIKIELQNSHHYNLLANFLDIDAKLWIKWWEICQRLLESDINSSMMIFFASLRTKWKLWRQSSIWCSLSHFILVILRLLKWRLVEKRISFLWVSYKYLSLTQGQISRDNQSVLLWTVVYLIEELLLNSLLSIPLGLIMG